MKTPLIIVLLMAASLSNMAQPSQISLYGYPTKGCPPPFLEGNEVKENSGE
ncbi:MAG: hypothetical protein HYY40_07190 [Bacteroidetes bacterium]|nr:hypothetical protein [Bacteroidota bacterium]